MAVDVFTSQAGYIPSSRKIAVLDGRYAGSKHFVVRDNHTVTGIVYRGELQPVTCDWGRYAIADISALDNPGMYQIAVSEETQQLPVDWPDASYPFPIARDAYVRSLRMAVGYYYLQRCGTAVPGYHPACHMDDAHLRRAV